MDNAVALAAIALAGTAVGSLVWVMKYFATKFIASQDKLTDAIVEHSTAALQQKEASLKSANASDSLEKTVKQVGQQAELSAKNSQEQLKFMKKLNGKLEGAIVQKVTEQTVQHQTVEVKD